MKNLAPVVTANRRQLKRQLEGASRFKGELLARLSEEVRSTLSYVVGLAELLHEGNVNPGSPEHRQFIHLILTSELLLTEVVNDLVELSVGLPGSMVLPADSADPSKTVHGVLMTLAVVATRTAARTRARTRTLGQL